MVISVSPDTTFPMRGNSVSFFLFLNSPLVSFDMLFKFLLHFFRNSADLSSFWSLDGHRAGCGRCKHHPPPGLRPVAVPIWPLRGSGIPIYPPQSST
ncbi:hypothetical protein RhiirA1_484597 [Rhizophagus irregularis]|uniref:Uncharacterized protein n=1 Tax=Rhizophagus irregularis TaxID=588596 RepID=A0A2I1FMZ9_9GLOM|nr:hypothetical protein RhiirA1_484597 [Rhizophagus irregularis]PKY35754.1 hypothetical protein RhiirB3_457068 [Rhizophagus irregularis]